MYERQAIVVLDFPGAEAGRRCRTLGLEEFGGQVRYVLEEDAPRRITMDAYVSAILQDGNIEEQDVVGLVAYCTAAPIARALRSRLSFPGRPPVRVAFINPESPSLTEIADLVQEMLGEATVDISTRRRLRDGVAYGTVGQSEWFQEFENTLRLSHAEMLGSSGGDPEIDQIAAELAAAQSAWVAQLLVATEPDWAAPTGPEVHIVSADHPCGYCNASHWHVSSTGDDVFLSPGLGSEILKLIGLRSDSTAGVFDSDR